MRGALAVRGRETLKQASAILPFILLLGACGDSAATPELTAQQLMAQKVQPTAEIYWNSVQFISDETGDHEIFPKNDAEWEKTRQAAVELGKLGELLKTPGYTEGRKDDWTTFAQALVDISKRAEQAAVAKDAEAVFEVGGTVYSVCSACHQAYPATVGAEASEAAAAG